MLKRLVTVNKRVIKNTVRAAVVLAAAGCLAATQDLRSLLEGIKQISIVPLLWGIALYILANCFVGLRWKGLLNTLDIRFPLFAAVKITFVGMFYNNMLLSNIGGDLLRVWYVAKYTDKRIEAAFSVLVDRLCGLAACFIMAIAGLCMSKGLFTGQEGGSEPSAASGGQAVFIKLAVVLSVVAAVCLITVAVLWKKGRLNAAAEKLRTQISRFWAAVVIYLKNPLSISLAMAVTLIAQSISVLGIYTACSSLGIDAPLKVYFIFFPLSWVIGALPVSPGGLGILELGVVAMFASLPQVSNEQALTLALCQRIIFLAGSLPGLVIHLCGFHLPKEQ